MTVPFLIIAGMHRSGTSALTRICNLLGAELGDNLIPPLPNDNETGFWEDQTIVDINEAVLVACGTDHLTPRLLPDNWTRASKIKTLRKQLRDYLLPFIKNHNFPATKDPRLCRTLPLWLDILTEQKITPTFLLSIRHPLEVALSLHKRNKISLEQGLQLWVLYNLEMERATRGYPRGFVFYTELLKDWRSSIDTASRQAGFNWDKSYDSVAAQISQFLRRDLKHNDATEQAITIDKAIIDTFSIMQTATQTGTVNTAKLDYIYDYITKTLRPAPLWKRVVRKLVRG